MEAEGRKEASNMSCSCYVCAYYTTLKIPLDSALSPKTWPLATAETKGKVHTIADDVDFVKRCLVMIMLQCTVRGCAR